MTVTAYVTSLNAPAEQQVLEDVQLGIVFLETAIPMPKLFKEPYARVPYGLGKYVFIQQWALNLLCLIIAPNLFL